MKRKKNNNIKWTYTIENGLSFDFSGVSFTSLYHYTFYSSYQHFDSDEFLYKRHNKNYTSLSICMHKQDLKAIADKILSRND